MPQARTQTDSWNQRYSLVGVLSQDLEETSTQLPSLLVEPCYAALPVNPSRTCSRHNPRVIFWPSLTGVCSWFEMVPEASFHAGVHIGSKKFPSLSHACFAFVHSGSSPDQNV